VQTEFTDSVTIEQGDDLDSLLLNSALESVVRRLITDLKGTTDDVAITSRPLSEATEIYRELAITAKEMGLEINTDKTKLLIQSRKADKQIHGITLKGKQ
jgi:hypothetical protein